VSNENSNLDITARLDATGVQTGAKEAEGALQGVTGALSAATAAESASAAVAREYGVSLDAVSKALKAMGASSLEAVAGTAEFEAALEQVQRASAVVEAQLAQTTAALSVTAKGMAAELDISTALAASLIKLGISQDEVAASAVNLGISNNIAAAAMVNLGKSAIAAQVTDAKLALEGLTVATEAETAAAAESAAANDLDAEALAQRAIMMRRTSDGLVDIAMGGRRAIQGVADLQYVLTSLFPGGAATIAVLGGIALIGEIWSRTSEKMAREHHEATSKMKADTMDLASSIEPYKKALEDVLELQKQQLANDDRLLANANTLVGFAKKDEQQSKEKALQDLRQNFIVDEGTPHTTEQRTANKTRYEAAKKDIEDGSTVNLALLEAAQKQEEINITQQKLTDLQKQNADDTLAAATAASAARDARTRLDPYGISLGKNGALEVVATGKNPIEEKQKQIAEDEASVRQAGLLFGAPDTQDKAKYISSYEAKLIEERKAVQQLTDDQAALAQGSASEGITGKALPGQALEISKLQNQLSDLTKELQQANTGVGLAEGDRKQDADEANAPDRLKYTIRTPKGPENPYFPQIKALEKRIEDFEAMALANPDQAKFIRSGQINPLQNQIDGYEDTLGKWHQGLREKSSDFDNDQKQKPFPDSETPFIVPTGSLKSSTEHSKKATEGIKALSDAAEANAKATEELAEAAHGSIGAIRERLTRAESAIHSLKNSQVS
jgi:hypothetical protein